MPTDTQREPGPITWPEATIQDYETVGAIHDLLKAHRASVRELERSDSAERTQRAIDEFLRTEHALIIAIAKRVREAECRACGHDPKNLATARITDAAGNVRWATICTQCEHIVDDDRERLDWMLTKVVEVRDPTPYGSLHLFIASPGDEDEPSDLRAQIDAVRQQEAPHAD